MRFKMFSEGIGGGSVKSSLPSGRSSVPHSSSTSHSSATTAAAAAVDATWCCCYSSSLDALTATATFRGLVDLEKEKEEHINPFTLDRRHTTE